MAPSTRVYAALAAIIGWFAVIAQLYLAILNRTTSLPEALIRFFSFFTILSNILFSLCLSSFFIKGKWKRFFTATQTLSAVTVYILAVGIVYNIVLRSIWNPVGLQKLVDELLHSVTPILMLIFWLFSVPKKELQWKHAFVWMVFPLSYMAFIAIRGALSGFYPYPFANVTELGYPMVLMNGSILVMVFFGLSLVLIAVAKGLSRK